MSEINYRIATPEDFAETWDVASEAIGDFRLGKHNIDSAPPTALQPRDHNCRAYVHRFHRESFWVAESGSRIVGFTFSWRSPDRWYLGALHVRPDYQGRGIGTRLMERALKSAQPADVRCVIADAIQAPAKMLYIRAGMLPWLPLIEWAGAVPDLDEDSQGASFRTVTSPDPLASIDEAVLGFQRPAEHKVWMQNPEMMCGLLSIDNVPTGYVHLSKEGDIGPLATVSEPMAKPLLHWALARLKEHGVEHVHLKVPGLAPSIQEAIVDARLRMREPAQVILSSKPLWTPGQYLVSAADAIM